MSDDEPRCSGCYDSFSGWWCDNCDQWPCICVEEELLAPQPPPPVPAGEDTAAVLAGLRRLAGVDSADESDYDRGFGDGLTTAVRRLDAAQAATGARAADGEPLRVEKRMEQPGAPDWGGEETDDGEHLYHHAWDSDDDELRLWVGPYAGEHDWAVTVSAPGLDLVLRCAPDQIVEWTAMVRQALEDSGSAPSAPCSVTKGDQP